MKVLGGLLCAVVFVLVGCGDDDESSAALDLAPIGHHLLVAERTTVIRLHTPGSSSVRYDLEIDPDYPAERLDFDGDAGEIRLTPRALDIGETFDLTASACPEGGTGGCGTSGKRRSFRVSVVAEEPFAWLVDGEPVSGALPVPQGGFVFNVPGAPTLQLSASMPVFCPTDDHSLEPSIEIGVADASDCPSPPGCNVGKPVAGASTSLQIDSIPEVVAGAVAVDGRSDGIYPLLIGTFEDCQASNGLTQITFPEAVAYMAPTPTPSMGPPPSPTSTPVASVSREITFVNACDVRVWAAWVTGASSGGLEMPEACTADADCQVGGGAATCNGNGHCEITLRLAENAAGQVSGRVWPRTGCAFDSGGLCPIGRDGTAHNCCATGGCTADELGKNFGLACRQSGIAPTTVAEFTLEAAATDYYDVSVIDGINVAMQMAPASGTQAACPHAEGDIECDYWCGNPGSREPLAAALDACPWDLGTDCGDVRFRVVAPTFVSDASQCRSDDQYDTSSPIGSVCTCGLVDGAPNDADCSNGEVCGFANNEIEGTRVCGAPIGCTTGKALCGIGRYFSARAPGAACDGDSQCGGECVDGSCAESAVDFLACGDPLDQVVACRDDLDCPALIGFGCASDADCPYPTTCVPLGATPTGPPPVGAPPPSMVCRQPCEDQICVGAYCESDTDCLQINTNPPTCGVDADCSPGWRCAENATCAVVMQACAGDDDCAEIDGNAVVGWACDTAAGECRPPQRDSGTFSRCDTATNQCVGTNASLLQNAGVNGQSCYIPYYATTCASGAKQGMACDPSSNDCGDGVACEQRVPSVACGGCPTACPDCDPPSSGDPAWPDATLSCRNTNPDWVDYVAPMLAPLKKTCPTAYSFPFDDPTSTFQCSGQERIGYTITFCP